MSSLTRPQPSPLLADERDKLPQGLSRMSAKRETAGDEPRIFMRFLLGGSDLEEFIHTGRL